MYFPVRIPPAAIDKKSQTDWQNTVLMGHLKNYFSAVFRLYV